MCEKSVASSSSTHESRRRAPASYADDTGDMEEEKYAEEDDCDAPTDESITPQSLTQTPYQQLLSSQNVVNGSFNPEFLSAFGISLTEIPADITSLSTDTEIQ